MPVCLCPCMCVGVGVVWVAVVVFRAMPKPDLPMGGYPQFPAAFKAEIFHATRGTTASVGTYNHNCMSVQYSIALAGFPPGAACSLWPAVADDTRTAVVHLE